MLTSDYSIHYGTGDVCDHKVLELAKRSGRFFIHLISWMEGNDAKALVRDRSSSKVGSLRGAR